MREVAYLGVGSNLGQREAFLRQAAAWLADEGLTPLAVSGVWESEPWDVPDRQPPYLNAVLRVAVPDGASPPALLSTLQRVEARACRERNGFRSARTLDVDLLALEREGKVVVVREPRLTLPHPRAQERAFVCLPWAELAPHLRLQADGEPLAALAQSLRRRQSCRRVGRFPEWEPDALSHVRALPEQEVGHEVRVWESATSTNDLALAAGRQGAASGLVFLAEAQTQGRGRLGRAWFSPPGSAIYGSVLLRTSTAGRWPLLPLLAAVALCRAIERTTGLEPGIKWPNDVLVDGRKIAGILIEAQPQAGFLVLGIGINVNLCAADLPEALRTTAGALNLAWGGPVSRPALTRTLLTEIEQAWRAWQRGGEAQWLEEWRRRSVTLGRWVTVFPPGGTAYQAQALDVDDHGALVVRRDDGQEERLLAGEVSLTSVVAQDA